MDKMYLLKFQPQYRFFIIFMLLACSLVSEARTRRAVIIGLGEYQDKTWSKIHGDSDVPIVKNMLSKCGYSDVTTLINKQAKKADILSAFQRLADKCRKGDIVYIHFSGHGQQITDLNGDEDDGLDEAWIPYDAMYAYSSRYKGDKHLIDDEIALWMTKIKSKIGQPGRLLLVVDACHSGDSSRGGMESDSIFIRGAEKDFIIPLKKKPRKTAKVKENWLTLSACRDYQVNCEVRTASGRYYGMLSYALCNQYKLIKNKSNKMASALLQNIVDKYQRDLQQDIVLTGITTKHVLSIFFE